MKRIVFLLLLVIVLGNVSISQVTPQQKLDSVSLLFKKYFNEKNTEQLYALTGESFRKTIPLETFEKLNKEQLFPLGDIKALKFENHTNGMSKYKTEFNTAILGLYLSLDKVDKLESFFLKPYVEESGQ